MSNPTNHNRSTKEGKIASPTEIATTFVISCKKCVQGTHLISCKKCGNPPDHE